jgi:hypothetical protein
LAWSDETSEALAHAKATPTAFELSEVVWATPSDFDDLAALPESTEAIRLGPGLIYPNRERDVVKLEGLLRFTALKRLDFPGQIDWGAFGRLMTLCPAKNAQLEVVGKLHSLKSLDSDDGLIL